MEDGSLQSLDWNGGLEWNGGIANSAKMRSKVTFLTREARRGHESSYCLQIEVCKFSHQPGSMTEITFSVWVILTWTSFICIAS